MAVDLYNNQNHTCLMFTDLVQEDGMAIQANQFLIVNNGEGAIIDPGGNLSFNELYMSLSRHFVPRDLRY